MKERLTIKIVTLILTRTRSCVGNRRIERVENLRRNSDEGSSTTIVRAHKHEPLSRSSNPSNADEAHQDSRIDHSLASRVQRFSINRDILEGNEPVRLLRQTDIVDIASVILGIGEAQVKRASLRICASRVGILVESSEVEPEHRSGPLACVDDIEPPGIGSR